MKKLLVAAVALAAGVASADIVSSSVVGYASKATTEGGFAFYTPCFKDVNGTGYSIQDIIPSSGFEGWGSESLQILDKDGNVSEYYTYCNEYLYGKAGWYDENSTLATRKIKNGESFLVNNDAGPFTIQFAGEVSTTATSATSEAGGFCAAGNSSPVEQDIQGFAPVSGFEGWGSESLQILDKDGNVSEYYTYCNEYLYGEAGWYDENSLKATRKIDAGEGFLISNDAGAYEVTIPAVSIQ